MVRFILLSLLLTFLLRALMRLWAGFVQGVQGQQEPMRGSSRGHAPQRSVQMARDPICGTFVVPERATVLTTGGRTLYFCSTDCRDAYLAHGAPDRPATVHGRTA